MFKPEELEAIPVYLQEIFRELQLNVMIDIVQRIKANNEIPPTADYEISRLYELGASKRQIKKYIKDSLDLSTQEVNHLYKDVLRKGYVRNESLYKAKGKSKIRFEDNEPLQQLINAVKKQTNDEFKNITQSMGFAVKQPDGSLKFTKLADYYQRTLDRASVDVLSGVYDYNAVLNRTVKEMTNSGLRTVDYASGYSNRVEVAARRALMTGYNQVVGRIAEDDAEILDTEYFEITRHIGARPTHQPWQGRVYSRDELVSVCGYGTVTGLKGANCYHDMMPFIKGVSERVYTDEELDRMNQEENTPKKYGNREYTTYEALQRQRRLETKMRAQRQEIKLLSEGGANEDDILALKSKYNGTQSEYVNFSKAMNLPQEWDRVTVDGLGNIGSKSLKKKSKAVAKSENGGIINSGAISGALNPYSKKASEHAIRYYEAVRHMTTDTSKISIATNIKKDKLDKIKNHIFIKEHDLLDGHKRFTPSYDMAQSWQRLISGKYEKKDIVLLKHEYAEIRYMEKGLSQNDAHIKASKRYNYAKYCE